MTTMRNILALWTISAVSVSALAIAPPTPGDAGSLPPPVPTTPAAPSLVRVDMFLDLAQGDLPETVSELEAGCNNDFALDVNDCTPCLECIHVVTWQDNSNNETGFQVYRRATTSIYWSLVASTPANQRVAFVNATSQENVTYEYKVRARRLNSYSAFSPGVTTSDTCEISIPH